MPTFDATGYKSTDTLTGASAYVIEIQLIWGEDEAEGIAPLDLIANPDFKGFEGLEDSEAWAREIFNTTLENLTKEGTTAILTGPSGEILIDTI